VPSASVTLVACDATRCNLACRHTSESNGTLYPAINPTLVAFLVAPLASVSSHASVSTSHAASPTTRALAPAATAAVAASTSTTSASDRGAYARVVIVPPKNIVPITVMLTTNHSMNRTTSTSIGRALPSVCSTIRPDLNLFSALSGCSVRTSLRGMSCAPAALDTSSTKPATTTVKSSMFQYCRRYASGANKNPLATIFTNASTVKTMTKVACAASPKDSGTRLFAPWSICASGLCVASNTPFRMTHARMNVSNHGRERTVSHARRNAESGGNTRSESGLAYTRRTRSVGAAKSASKIRSRRLRTRRASALACASIASASTSMSIIASSSSFARSSASSGESGGDESSAESSLARSMSNTGVVGSRGVRMDDGIARDWDAGLIEQTLRGPPEDVSADETRVPLTTRSPRSGLGNPHPGVRPDPATDATSEKVHRRQL